MPIAALYDIHANLPALEAVLDDARRAGVDQVVVGGDVLPGPMPRETITRLLELQLPVQFIQGNGDREVLARLRGIETGGVPEKYRAGMDWNAQQLGVEHEQLLAGWPSTLQLPVRELCEVLFCHATPRNDTEIFTAATPEVSLKQAFAGVNAQVVVCGHTHMQFDRIVAGIRVVNAGSVGMPFGEPGAYWLQLGPDVQPRRTSYDFARAAERIRSTKSPEAEEFAAHNVLHPPSAEDMLQAFARVELR